MLTWIACLIAVISTTAFLILWFREAKRLLREQKHMIETARKQLEHYRKISSLDRTNPENIAVVTRSRDIYRQAVAHYNAVLQKPWIYVPGKLMGFEKEKAI